MDKVVYLLGAGFSAPLGLPVMNDFLIKAKDLFASDPLKFEHFGNVFKRIEKMHVAKSYYEADLMNIEEILSILEMGERIDGSDTEFFTRFLCDVIIAYTPKIPELTLDCANWYEVVISRSWNPYFAFAMSLLRLRLSLATTKDYGKPRTWLVGEVSEPSVAEYGVVSLNYDQVLEHMANAFNRTSNPFPNVTSKELKAVFLTANTKNSDGDAHVSLAKLHGCVSDERIIPPTWNKGLVPEMVDIWRKGRDLLANANQIRILGYSLPITDAYIKYLLKSAVIDSTNLKRIDVLCLDPTGHVSHRYKDFINFKFFRFASRSVESYLGHIASRIDGNVGSRTASYTTLETAHEEFFTAHGRMGDDIGRETQNSNY
jgi:hypothetical protein